ncbi:MAG: hypothetical protein M1823_002074 [Watsoniomyces obsoletus]|nr:MAG: hypothetical protein M1823_002074 [Watsoniomyces obsoletus]
MAPSRRNVRLVAEETSTPPDSLGESEFIARVTRAAGNNLFEVQLPSSQRLVELPSRFRSTVWIRRGGFVLVNIKALEHRENKIGGEIVNVVRDEKAWRKQPYWPKEFARAAAEEEPIHTDSEDDDDDQSGAGTG